MIAACPKCQAKYRVDAERLPPEGARLRCAKCQAAFRVRAPETPPAAEPAAAPVAAAPAVASGRVAAAATSAPAAASEAPVDRERLVVVADPDVDSAKRVMAALTSWGLQPVLVHDGVEALLTIQRTLPRAAILDAALPKMYGFQICEMVKRNESLRTMSIVLVGSVHHQDRYRRPPTDMYGADAYMEKPDLPEGLRSVLQGIGYPVSDAPPQPSEPAAQPSVAPSPPPALIEPQPAAPPPEVKPRVEPRVAPRVATPQPPPAPAPAADDGLADQRANAERLARIIVSDIVLYQPEQFAACVASGQLGDGLEAALSEGRGFFAQKVDPQVRDERDYIMEELQRVIRQRGGQ